MRIVGSRLEFIAAPALQGHDRVASRLRAGTAPHTRRDGYICRLGMLSGATDRDRHPALSGPFRDTSGSHQGRLQNTHVRIVTAVPWPSVVGAATVDSRSAKWRGEELRPAPATSKPRTITEETAPVRCGDNGLLDGPEAYVGTLRGYRGLHADTGPAA